MPNFAKNWNGLPQFLHHPFSSNLLIIEIEGIVFHLTLKEVLLVLNAPSEVM